METKKLEQELSQSLTEVRTKIEIINKTIDKCDQQLLLSKAKLQVLGISTKELNKLKPVSQGIQAEIPNIQNVQDQQQQEILVIEDDEHDTAVKDLLVAEKPSIPVTSQVIDVVNTLQFTFTVPQNIAYTATMASGQEVIITPQNAAAGSARQENIAYGNVTAQNVTITGQNIVTRQNVIAGQNVITGQNVVTGQNIIIGDTDNVVEYTPYLSPWCS